jgi:uncharacterized YccA/Bax inhibitor family protein
MAGADHVLFGADSLATYGGLSLAVIVVTNGVSSSLKLKEPAAWMPLVISLVICILARVVVAPFPNAAEWLVTVLNGFLIYATALGGNRIGFRASQIQGGGIQSFGASKPSIKSSFFRKWL